MTNKLSNIDMANEMLGILPKALTGILLILSLLGGVYANFFQIETDARDNYNVLAPEVDLAINQSDQNAVLIQNLTVELKVLQQEKEILQQLLIGFLTSQGKYKSIQAISEPITDIISSPKIPSSKSFDTLVPISKRRQRQVPIWKLNTRE